MDEKTLVESMIDSFPKDMQPVSRAKLNYFEDEIEMITDPKIKSFVRSVMKMADPFWLSPATMIEGMHPPDEYGPEGLILHTKRVFRTAALLMATVDIDANEADCVFAAALLHDITKAFWVDEGDKIVAHDVMHPYTVDVIVQMCRKYDEENNIHPPEDNSLEIDRASLEFILKLIRHSHGVFSPIPETIPTNDLENILATADLIAANMHVLIDGHEIEKDRWFF
jgi:hypothetical protein